MASVTAFNCDPYPTYTEPVCKTSEIELDPETPGISPLIVPDPGDDCSPDNWNACWPAVTALIPVASAGGRLLRASGMAETLGKLATGLSEDSFEDIAARASTIHTANEVPAGYTKVADGVHIKQERLFRQGDIYSVNIVTEPGKEVSTNNFPTELFGHLKQDKEIAYHQLRLPISIQDRELLSMQEEFNRLHNQTDFAGDYLTDEAIEIGKKYIGILKKTNFGSAASQNGYAISTAESDMKGVLKIWLEKLKM